MNAWEQVMRCMSEVDVVTTTVLTTQTCYMVVVTTVPTTQMCYTSQEEWANINQHAAPFDTGPVCLFETSWPGDT